MGWFSKKEVKTPLVLLEEELIRQHKLLGEVWNRDKAMQQIDKINSILIGQASQEMNAKLEKRLKSIEDAIGDLYLAGKSDDKA